MKGENFSGIAFFHVACQIFVVQFPNKVTWVTFTSHLEVWCKLWPEADAARWQSSASRRWRLWQIASRGEVKEQFEPWNWRGSKCQWVTNKVRSLHPGKCVWTWHCTHSYGIVWQLCNHHGKAARNTVRPGTPPPTPTHTHTQTPLWVCVRAGRKVCTKVLGFRTWIWHLQFL